MLGLDGFVISNAEWNGLPDETADQHLANIMKAHLESDLQATEDNDLDPKQLLIFKQLLEEFEVEDYELLRAVNDGGAVLHLMDSSLGGEFRTFSEPLKNLLVNYATSLGT